MHGTRSHGGKFNRVAVVRKKPHLGIARLTPKPSVMFPNTLPGGDYRFIADTPAAAHPGGNNHNQERQNIMHTITKDQFVAVLDAAGVSDAQKHRFHAELEKRHPAAHQQLLEWLGIPAAEIARIREHARG